jgi:hypothetical protein
MSTFEPGERVEIRHVSGSTRGTVVSCDVYGAHSYYKVRFDGKESAESVLGLFLSPLSQLDSIVEQFDGPPV